MSEAKQDGGPAFPAMHFDLAENERGMTLRDYFAAKAMQGVFTNPVESSEHGKDYIAMHAYKMADAMIKARQA
jgi:hypothetical protein